MHKGDVFAGKGVGMCRIKLDERSHLSIYTAHVSKMYMYMMESQGYAITLFIIL